MQISLSEISQYLPKINMLKLSVGKIIFLLLVSFFSVYCQYQISNLYINAARGSQLQLYLLYSLAIAFAFSFYFIKYSSFESLFQGLARSCAIGMAIYLIVEPTDLTLVYPEQQWRYEFANFMYPLAVVFAIVGIWRPSFVFLPATYAIAIRYMSADIYGIESGTLDIRYLAEMCQYLTVSSVVLYFLNKICSKSPGKNKNICFLIQDHALEICIAFNAIAFHFGNYFWSGVAKLAHGPSITTWILENPTHNTITVALEKGVLIFGQWPMVTDYIYKLFSITVIPINTFILITQFAAIVAIFSRKLIIWSSIFYDALHIGLYILNGLFFWPWVWINIAILFGVKKMRDTPINTIAKISCFLVITMGSLLGYVKYAHLAWLETPNIKSPYFEVKTPTNNWLKVPLSFFGSHLYSVSHGSIDKSIQIDHYLPSNWSAVKFEEFVERDGCQNPRSYDDSMYESLSEKIAREHHISTFIRERHRQVLKRLDDEGRFFPYLQSHHHPSNPLLYSEFNQLDLRKVKEYRFVVESVCLSLDSGNLKRKVINGYKVAINVSE